MLYAQFPFCYIFENYSCLINVLIPLDFQGVVRTCMDNFAPIRLIPVDDL